MVDVVNNFVGEKGSNFLANFHRLTNCGIVDSVGGGGGFDYANLLAAFISALLRAWYHKS